MLYSQLIKKAFRLIHGPTPVRSDAAALSSLVLMADGVGGLDLCGTGLNHAAAKAGSSHQVRMVPWGHGFGHWHQDLTNVENHKKWAHWIADEVAAYRSDHASSPVYLVGKSGGTGVVVKALEFMPADLVESAVLISSALSPDYDLSRALKSVRCDMTVFWSPLDWIVLGAGTRIFGTVDRKNKVSAGLVGFRRPKDLDESGTAQYHKLKQIRWTPGMASTGYLGGHVGPDSPAFLRRYVLPLLEVKAESPERAEQGSSLREDAPIT
jgi:pimeloyl-ACP methyl ester carboxylesterase